MGTRSSFELRYLTRLDLYLFGDELELVAFRHVDVDVVGTGRNGQVFAITLRLLYGQGPSQHAGLASGHDVHRFRRRQTLADEAHDPDVLLRFDLVRGVVRVE